MVEIEVIAPEMRGGVRFAHTSKDARATVHDSILTIDAVDTDGTDRVYCWSKGSWATYSIVYRDD